MATFKPEEIKALEVGGNGVGSELQTDSLSNPAYHCMRVLQSASQSICHVSCRHAGGLGDIFGQMESQGCTEAHRQVWLLYHANIEVNGIRVEAQHISL